MSKLILFGPTALEFYRSCERLAFRSAHLDTAEGASFRPTGAGVRFLESRLPFLSKPYHLTVLERKDRRALNGTCCHVATPSVQSSSHNLIADGVFAPSPELAYLQACRGIETIDAIIAGSLLCSAFALRGATQELAVRPHLTSPEAIEEASALHRSVPGCQTARKALPWIIPNARSPREVALALALTLPGRLGGYCLPRPLLNYPIELGARAREIAARNFYIADVCWPREHLVMEYDSDEHHLTSEQLSLDSAKRMTLDAMGYRVITVTRLQLNTPQAMDAIARAAASALSTQLRFRAHDFREKQKALWLAAGLARPSRTQSARALTS